MSANHPAKPTVWARYLLLGMAAGVMAVAVACGDAKTPVPTPPVSTSTPGSTPLTTLSPTVGVTGLPVTAVPTTIDPGQMQVVRINEVAFPVELALKPEERIKGLSGRAFLDSGTGMLFVFEVESRLRFWMREMEIPLDMVWIGAGCEVVDISRDVPPPDPDTPLDELPRYSPNGLAQYVLEINGGESAALGLGPGDPVKFVGALAGKYGC